ncbi:CHAP domain-containing protein [Ktedonospora formicarum]|uniref:Peptidase C51 domain-containing protein n=1 Tax=Ktedonospora formicarum TaxID=2778364 RepID=A0A8J3HXC7_9CHLR|nr:CHAP domain-containing protein [Ktedonospora formicarum]GHO42795.1 hypothetical protein KSX_09580 [Ktedonospora formicarum]
MSSFMGKGAAGASLGGGFLSGVGGLVSALGLQMLGIISVGTLLLGSIGSWWFQNGAPTYYASDTVVGDLTTLTGDDMSMIKSGNPVLVALAIEHNLTDYKGHNNNYDYNNPIMQIVIQYWRKICGGRICPEALPVGKTDGGILATNFLDCSVVQLTCGNGFQCAMFISTVFGLSGNALPAKGNAIDYWRANHSIYENAGWKYINNGSGMPSIGDLAVMDHGVYGHIMLVVGVTPPSGGKDGTVYLAQGNAPGNTNIHMGNGDVNLLKWPLKSNGFATINWSSEYTLLGFIHKDDWSKKWGDPFSTTPYTPSGDAKCDEKARAMPESQARQLAAQAGFSGHGLDVIIAIAHAESSLNPKNCLLNKDWHDWYPQWHVHKKGRTLDRGIMQINNYWHFEVKDECAFDPLCSFKEAYKISNKGTSFSPWTTYTGGAYRKYMP